MASSMLPLDKIVSDIVAMGFSHGQVGKATKGTWAVGAGIETQGWSAGGGSWQQGQMPGWHCWTSVMLLLMWQSCADEVVHQVGAQPGVEVPACKRIVLALPLMYVLVFVHVVCLR